MKVEPYLVGVLFGDGSMHKTKTGAYAVWIDQAEKNKGIIDEEIVPRLEELSLNVQRYRYYVKAEKKYKYRALVYSKELYEELSENFQNVVSYFKQLSDEGAKEFIAGFMDAEGTVTDRVVIYNENQNLLRTIQEKLNQMEIMDTHIYRYGSIHGLQIFRRKSIEKFVREIPAYRLKSLKIEIIPKELKVE